MTITISEARRIATQSPLVLLSIVAAALLVPDAWAQTATERVSKAVDPAQQPNNFSSSRSSMSLDGRYVAFASYASNLVAGDSNGNEDVFLYDRSADTTTRISVDTASGDANGSSSAPSLSYSGMIVAFHSNASDLVDEDINDNTDVFVHFSGTDEMSLISVSSSEEQGNDVSYFASVSGDGRFVAFTSFATNLVQSDTNGFSDVFVRDYFAGETQGISTGGNGRSYDAEISGDGRYVAFTSYATNLVAGDTNDVSDVYVYDQFTGAYELVSVSSEEVVGDGWSQAPAISRQGRFVAFMSTATNLVENDVNGARDVFVRDRQNGTTERVGQYVENLEGIGRLDISDDGRYVAYPSFGTDVVPDDTNGATDVFVFDRWTGVTERVSLTNAGGEGDGASRFPSFGDDGRAVAFASSAENLVTADSNGVTDIFVRSSWPTEVVFADIFESGFLTGWSAQVGFDEVCLSEYNDDGQAENLFILTPGTLNGTFVGKFVPPAYPFRPTAVSVSFTRSGSWDSAWLDYEVVFYDDDGPGGMPGTFLGSVPASAYWIQGLPFYHTIPVAVGGAIPAVTSGALYVGARWPSVNVGGIGIAVDEELQTTPQQSYYTADGIAGWTDVSGGGFKSLFVQACGQ